MFDPKSLNLLAGAVFVLHILGNFCVARPGEAAAQRLEGFRRLSIFPPDCVFGIWLVIWTLQGIMLVMTHQSPLWTAGTTAMFILICVGNLGSQIAGARNLPWFVYSGFIFCMFAAACSFMVQTSSHLDMPIVGIWASQLYVGWASMALLIAAGVVLVFEKTLMTNQAITIVAVGTVMSMLSFIWISWALNFSDYRILSIPGLILLTTLGVKYFASNGVKTNCSDE